MGILVDNVVFGAFEVIKEAKKGELKTIWHPIVDNFLVGGIFDPHCLESKRFAAIRKIWVGVKEYRAVI